MSFNDLDLDPTILKALKDAGYTEPSPIQKEAIPKVLEGCDLRASAQTGTGKTAAFLLPILNKLCHPSAVKGRGARALILAPTRELAQQIETQAKKYSQHMRHAKTVCLVGGVPYHAQNRKLARPHDILIATPGRLIDFIKQKKVDFSRLEVLVLDEADRMLDMGFLEPVEEIVECTPKERQTILFSATFQGRVVELSNRLLQDPAEVVIHAEKTKHENIDQKLHYADNIGHKNKLLNHILTEEVVHHAIVFTATKRHAEQLADELKEQGFLAAALHGDMTQRQRNRTIRHLRNGQVNILVATDVASRGIDVQTISHVINFDLPHNPEDYVHRIGRTGRAGRTGTALSFAAGKDGSLVKQIERFTGHPLNVVEIAGLEPRPHRPNKRPQSKQHRRTGNKRPTSKGYRRQGQRARNAPSFRASHAHK